MILLLAILAGLLAGLLRAALSGNRLNTPNLHLIWLVLLAFLPQLFAFQLPATRRVIPDEIAALALIVSQLGLFVFAWFNRGQPGFWMLEFGLSLNLIVIVLNRGLMPIRPEIIPVLAPNAPPAAWQVGERLGISKDIVLPVAETRLWFLSDWFLLPPWFPFRAAFSLGDVFIAVGAFWFFWSLGGHTGRYSKGEIGA